VGNKKPTAALAVGDSFVGLSVVDQSRRSEPAALSHFATTTANTAVRMELWFNTEPAFVGDGAENVKVAHRQQRRVREDMRAGVVGKKYLLHMRRILALVLLFSAVTAFAEGVSLSDAQALAIGKRIWKNECAGTVSGLTSWNKGEDFASLGIGHFIWYPTSQGGPFEESFPKLIAYFNRLGIKTPKWMSELCPWKTRAAFVADFESERMKQLRSLLSNSVAAQARFCALRLEQALPKMLDAAPKSERARIRENFYRVAAAPSGKTGSRPYLGMYALIDYVNFKGEGTSSTERYNGQGWGLLQVLEEMGGGSALPSFAKAADHVLTRRVENSPKARHESQWLPGWRNRIATYAN
jgi:hypothetical protein